MLAVGLTGVSGEFLAGDAIEVFGPDGVVFAKGLASLGSEAALAAIGEHAIEAIHRDDFVVLPAAAD